MNASDVVHGLSFDFSFPQSQHNSETPMEVSETIFQRLYLIYMPCCVVIGSTGNAMVWILIKKDLKLWRKISKDHVAQHVSPHFLTVFHLMADGKKSDTPFLAGRQLSRFTD
ncbi:unnamed protein product [Nippostrongylus brasiliensis]|uniref:G_PROTEIN_RECEP_F1_2 domain-containing protein n=1 Tax=Nippostrongylus brasiliensis TaxID=27835 RepID=A0A0N4YGE1_NIPBR|nr:unnamed protein product [Nippostrongylus brasiliensis]